MTKTKKVHIVGAGLSGMVAAINLAREGHQVTVLEAAKKIGDIHPYHPSNHLTPINLELIKNYVGIDITSCLTPAGDVYVYINSKKYLNSLQNGYSVERGPRQTSLDTHLYNIAKELGVEFQFNQEVKDPFDLPDPTIIATGLFREMNEFLKRPLVCIPIFLARRKCTDPNRQGESRSWFGSYTNTYAYAAILNDLDFLVLFSDRRDLSLLNLREFEEELHRSEGTRIDHWDYLELVSPVGRPDAPQLFAGSKILAGTLAGMMEPGMYFGIHGALVSGKVAAQAITDPETAHRDFKRFGKGYKQCWYLNRFINNPQRQYFYQLYFRFPAIFNHLTKFADTGIPGVDHYYIDMNTEYVGRY